MDTNKNEPTPEDMLKTMTSALEAATQASRNLNEVLERATPKLLEFSEKLRMCALMVRQSQQVRGNESQRGKSVGLTMEEIAADAGKPVKTMEDIVKLSE